jgi:hypothetical protein
MRQCHETTLLRLIFDNVNSMESPHHQTLRFHIMFAGEP